MNDKWRFYRDSNDQWRWQRIASNGRIVGSSSEGYQNLTDCQANARRNGWDGNQ